MKGNAQEATALVKTTVYAVLILVYVLASRTISARLVNSPALALQTMYVATVEFVPRLGSAFATRATLARIVIRSVQEGHEHLAMATEPAPRLGYVCVSSTRRWGIGVALLARPAR